MSTYEFVRMDTRGVKLEPNISQRFESRWSQVKIIENHSVFLRGLEGLVFGIYSALSGEGKIEVEEELDDSLYPMRYVDLDNEITEKYPFNPSGSAKGRAGVISEDGRHFTSNASSGENRSGISTSLFISLSIYTLVFNV